MEVPHRRAGVFGIEALKKSPKISKGFSPLARPTPNHRDIFPIQICRRCHLFPTGNLCPRALGKVCGRAGFEFPPSLLISRCFSTLDPPGTGGLGSNPASLGQQGCAGIREG